MGYRCFNVGLPCILHGFNLGKIKPKKYKTANALYECIETDFSLEGNAAGKGCLRAAKGSYIFLVSKLLVENEFFLSSEKHPSLIFPLIAVLHPSLIFPQGKRMFFFQIKPFSLESRFFP